MGSRLSVNTLSANFSLRGMPYEPLALLRHCRTLHTDSRRATGIRSTADSERSRLDVGAVLFPDH